MFLFSNDPIFFSEKINFSSKLNALFFKTHLFEIINLMLTKYWGKTEQAEDF